jgi:hypothetical protein
MHHFQYRDDQLLCEELPIERIADTCTRFASEDRLPRTGGRGDIHRIV